MYCNNQGSITMFKIAWTSKITGELGCGQAIHTEEEAVAWREWANKNNPDISHWIEKDNVLKPLNLKGHRCSYGDLTFVPHTTPPTSQDNSPITQASSAALDAKEEQCHQQQ